jgi:hypothetical protein
VGLTFEDTLLGNIHMDEKRASRTHDCVGGARKPTVRVADYTDMFDAQGPKWMR